MRYILSFLLFCITFQIISTNKDYLDKMARAAITLRNIVKNKKYKMRNLQESDEIIPNTIPDLPPSVQESAKETLAPAQVFHDNVEMPSDIPLTQQGSPGTTAKSTKVQVKKFHKFERQTKALKFGVFLYFLNKPIVKTVIMRIIIKYKTRRLRSLQSTTTIKGESAPTTCVIKSEYEDKIGQIGSGDNIDYDCTSETSSSADIDEAKIDPTKPMVIGTETTPVSDIEFSEDSKDGTENLVTISNADVGVLDNTKYEIQDKKLILTGELKPKSTLAQGQRFNMDFFDTSNNKMKTVSCIVQNLNFNSGACTLECDTDATPLITNYGNLTLSKSTDADKLYLSINIPSDIDDAQKEATIDTNPSSSNNAFYRKNSSGLSGGAIAGIVIACVVVLAAASIAAIMLRKPTPPIDNTTVVGLKTVENV